MSHRIGGYDVVLVAVMPWKYKCPLCKRLMRDPIQTYRGEMACESCYVDATKDPNNNICPIDNEPIVLENGEKFFKDNHAKREVSQLQCYCNNRKSGCTWQGTHSELGTHSTNCVYKEITCTLCQDHIIQKDMKEHETVLCRFRITQCPYCACQYDAQSLEDHKPTCHMKPMQCPYDCGESVVLNQLYNHLENCSKILTGSICPYQVVGCKYQPGSSVDLNNHMQEAGRKHAAFTVSLVTTLQEGNKKMQNNLLSEQTLRAELVLRVEEQKRDHSMLETEIQKIKEKLDSIQRENKSVQEKCESTESKVKDDMKEIELRIQQDSLDSIEKNLAEMKTKYDEFDAKLASGAIGRNASGGSNTEEYKQVSEKVNRLEKGSAVLSASLSDLELKLQLFENTSYDGRQLWKVDNVLYRMTQAVNGKVTALHSAPCFQKMGGYKFCTRLYLNGDGMGRGTHVSLFFVVMKSEYDALLQWPFNKRVTFRLINPYKREESIVESFIPDKNSSSFKKPQKDMNIAAGCPMFLRKEKLSQFIMDDVIFIECTIGADNMN